MSKLYKYTDKEFYPTPPDLINRMIRKLHTEKGIALEPSAGKGDIAKRLKQKGFTVYCIEKDKLLKKILERDGFKIVGDDFDTYEAMSIYDCILMNPPFSKGCNHLLRAWNLLKVSGEVVCLLNAETIKNPYSKNRKVLQELIKYNGYCEFFEDEFVQAEKKTSVEIALVYLKKPIYENEFDFSSIFVDMNFGISFH